MNNNKVLVDFKDLRTFYKARYQDITDNTEMTINIWQIMTNNQTKVEAQKGKLLFTKQN